MELEKDTWREKLQKHHTLVMVIGCALPIAVAFISAYVWGLQRSYWVWLFLLLCPLVHYLLMKEFHKEHPSEQNDTHASHSGGKKSCCH